MNPKITSIAKAGANILFGLDDNGNLWELQRLPNGEYAWELLRRHEAERYYNVKHMETFKG